MTNLPVAEHQDVRTVEFTKGPGDSLGISIAGGVGSPLGDIPIFIAMMNPDGLAAQTQLKVEDLPEFSRLLLTSSKIRNVQTSNYGFCFNTNNLSYVPQFYSSPLCLRFLKLSKVSVSAVALWETLTIVSVFDRDRGRTIAVANVDDKSPTLSFRTQRFIEGKREKHFSTSEKWEDETMKLFSQH